MKKLIKRIFIMMLIATLIVPVCACGDKEGTDDIVESEEMISTTMQSKTLGSETTASGFNLYKITAKAIDADTGEEISAKITGCGYITNDYNDSEHRQTTLIAEKNAGVYQFEGWQKKADGIESITVSTWPNSGEYRVDSDKEFVAQYRKAKYTIACTSSPETLSITPYPEGSTDTPYGTSTYAAVSLSENEGIVFKVSGKNSTYNKLDGIYCYDKERGLVDINTVREIDVVSNSINVDKNGNVWGNLEVAGSNKWKKDMLIVIKLKASDNDKAYPYQVITGFTPDGGGTTGGDQRGQSNFSAQISAYPSEGYDFDYWSYTDGSVEKTSKDSQMWVSCDGINVFIAHFKKAVYSVELAGQTPSNAGMVRNLGKYNWGNDATIEIVPDVGYSVNSWYYTLKNGVKKSGTGNTIQIDNIKEDIYLHVEYKSLRSNYTVSASPASAGIAYIRQVGTEFYNEDKKTANEVPPDTTVVIKAAANSGQKFLYWKDSKGTVIKGAEYSFNSATDDNFTAYFAKSDSNVALTVYPNGAGEVQLDSNGFFENYTEKLVGGEKHTISAKPVKSGYKFDHWEWKNDSATTVTNPNPVVSGIDVDDLEDDAVLTAVFTAQLHTVSAASNPSIGGTVKINNVFDSLKVNDGDKAVLVATPSDGYTFMYWKDSTGNQYYGTTEYPTGKNTLEISEVHGDVSMTAYFSESKLLIMASSYPYEAGLIKIDSYTETTDYSAIVLSEVDAGYNVTLTAQSADSKYKFSYWQDSLGNKYNTNPLIIPEVSVSMNYTAVFSLDSSDTGFKVVASPAIGGYVSKSINTIWGYASINATANKGYKFVCWKKGDTTISTTPNTTVEDFSDGVVYTAYFEKDKNYDFKTDVTKVHFYSDERAVSNPDYKVSRSSIESAAKKQISEDRANYDKNTPKPSNYDAYEMVRTYYDNKLSDAGYIFEDDELITTKGEVMYMSVTEDYDDVVDGALKYSEDKFGDRYYAGILSVVNVRPLENFEPGEHTYLWKNSGAEFRDNIYLVYKVQDDDTYYYVTGVYDDELHNTGDNGYLRFTIDSDKPIVKLGAMKAIIMDNREEKELDFNE